MKYDPPCQRELNEIRDDLASKDNHKVIHALLDLLCSTNDFDLMLRIYMEYSRNDDFWIAKVAINRIGDLFREYSMELADRAVEVCLQLKIAKSNLNQKPVHSESYKLIGVIDDATEDINIFCNLG